jgi:hypothetical protein
LRILASLSLLAALVSGQQALPTLPSNIVLVGGGYSSSQSPHATAGAYVAILTSQPAGLYSYSGYSSGWYRGKPELTAQTGGEIVLRCVQPSAANTFCLLGSATAGVSSGSSTALAASLGGGVSWKHNRFVMILAPTWERTPTTGTVIRILFGRASS